jgi:hypothetical protein
MKSLDFPLSAALAVALMGLLYPATQLAGALVILALTVGAFVHLGWKASKWLQANTMRSAGKLDAGLGLFGILIFSHWLSPPADTIVAAVALAGLAILLTMLLRRLEPSPARVVSYGALL